MFGYLTANLEILTQQQKDKYKGYYCGLCESLENDFSSFARNTLTYDLTFGCILLNSLNNSADCITTYKNCPLHPFKKQLMITTDYNSYFSYMNMYLTYYKLLDDINDDNSLRAKGNAKKIKKYVEIIEEKYPYVTSIIKQQLLIMAQAEKENVTNCDVCSNCFGIIIAEILSFITENSKEDLKNFGYHLGKFIYLMDAVIDLKKDIKKQRYNPLVFYSDINYYEILMMVMEDVDFYYQKLALKQDKDIIDNVIYSGIWSKYQLSLKKGKQK
ncbi:MAG: DUF5685 family protein [Erysipelotrichaceae bacterium]